MFFNEDYGSRALCVKSETPRSSGGSGDVVVTFVVVGDTHLVIPRLSYGPWVETRGVGQNCRRRPGNVHADLHKARLLDYRTRPNWSGS